MIRNTYLCIDGEYLLNEPTAARSRCEWAALDPGGTAHGSDAKSGFHSSAADDRLGPAELMYTVQSSVPEHLRMSAKAPT